METVRRRVDHRDSTQKPIPSFPHVGTSDDPKDINSNKKKGMRDDDYRNYLFSAIAIPFVIILIFGGRYSLLTICFGGLLCYIFDLLGSVEGTLFVLILTIMALIASTIYAAQSLLLGSVLNFSFIIVCGIILLFLFLSLSGYFKSIVKEFYMLFVTLDVIMFSTLPLISSSIITWFVCVEAPSLDIVTCFSIFYFSYVVIFCHPKLVPKQYVKKRKVGDNSINEVVVRKDDSQANYVLLIPLDIMKFVYFIPIPISVLIHISVHHNVLSTNHTRIINLIVSIIFPTFLMLICSHKQLDYWPSNVKETVSERINILKYVCVALLSLCFYDHPVFDEIKSFSGYSEPVPSILFLGSILSLFFSYLSNRLYIDEKKNRENDFEISSSYNEKNKQYLQMLSSSTIIFVGLSVTLLSVLVNLPHQVIPVSILGAVAIAQFYHGKSWALIYQLVLVLIATISISVVAVAFTQKTIYFLDYSLDWYFELSMQKFCKLFSVLLSISLALPTLIQNPLGVDSIGGLLPSKYGLSEGSSNSNSLIGNLIFELLMPVLVFVFAALELMIRELNWGNIADIETIYPTYYFISTTVIIAIASISLYLSSIISLSSAWSVWIIQGAKLLHVMGVSSSGAFATFAIIFTYTLPFIRFISLSLEKEKQKNISRTNDVYDNVADSYTKTSVLNPLEVLFYIVFAGFSTYLVKSTIAEYVLSFMISTEPSDFQILSACFALYFSFLSFILLVYYKKFKFLRSILLVASLICIIISCEGFGRFTFSLDPSSSYYLTVSMHPEMVENDHSTTFLFFTAILIGTVWIGLVPVKNYLVFVAFSILFSFIATKAVIGWSFPLTMGSDDSMSHDMNQFPFVYTYVSNLFATFIGLWPSSSTSSSKSIPVNDESSLLSWTHIVCCSIPFVAFIWSVVMNKYYETHTGIVWHAIVVNCAVCLSTRIRDVVGDIKQLRSASNASKRISNTKASICVLSSILGVVWTVVLSFTDSVDKDIAIPLSTLLMIATRRNLIVSDTHPVAVSGMLSCVWWLFSAAYSIFVKGLQVDMSFLADFHSSESTFGGLGIFVDQDVSIWTNISLMYPIFNAFLIFLPLPGIYYGLVKSKDNSEEFLFLLALICALSIIGPQINSIRYLGIAGMLFASYRCYDIGQTHRNSERLI